MGFLFFFIFISLVLVAFFSLKNNDWDLVVVTRDDTSLYDLKKRYANGEISKKEFEVLKRYIKN